jgi:putative transcriptional regulator
MPSHIIKNKDAYMTGKLLLAAPGIGDPRFERAVIFMCAHDEQGAMGFMVNYTMPNVPFSKIVEQTGVSADINIDLNAIHVMNGGPVEESRGFLLHSLDFVQKDTININQKYGVTGTIEALRDFVQGKGPQESLFVLGHAGWSAGQLDQELQSNAWLVVDSTPDLVFKTPVKDKWSAALASIGINPAMLSSLSGRA